MGRIVPVVDDHDSGGHFAAAAEGRLAIRACTSCDAWLHLPRARCASCGSWETEWRDAGTTATVSSWTVVEHGVHPGYPVPYTAVLVDLDVAPEVHLVGYLPGRVPLHGGQPVEVWFERVDDDVVIPNWRPVGRSPG